MSPGTILSAWIFLVEVFRLLVCGIILASRDTSGGPNSNLLSLRSVAYTAPSALLYSIQNFAASIAQRNLPAVVYNLLNQSKVLSAALMSYLIMGKTQSGGQVVALFLVFAGAAAAVSGRFEGGFDSVSVLGTAAALATSALSGLSGSLADLAILKLRKDSFVFTAEMGIVTIGIMSMGFICDFCLRGTQCDIYQIYARGGLFEATGISWTSWQPLLPILSASVGGILVGQVTKLVGSVRKGFSVSAGVVLSALLERSAVDMQILIAITLALVGVIMHSLESQKLKTY